MIDAGSERSVPRRVLAGFLAALICAMLAGCERDPVGARHEPELAPDDVALNNRGVALMGRFEYEAAHHAFAGLVERRPDWTAARLNLAIATLNRQEPGDEQRAMVLVEEVLAADRDNLRAHYLAGLLELHAGNSDAALENFRRVAEGDPADAYAAYYVAQSLLQSGKVQETLPWYDRAIEQDPYLRSAYYGAALALRRLGDKDAARTRLEQYERFKDNPRARLAELKYTRMGPKAEALAVGDPDALPPEPLAGPLFQAPERVAGEFAAGSGAALTTVDLDVDGHQDLFVTHAGSEQPNALLLGDGDGEFAPLAGHPLAAPTQVVAALWGDIDNDGLVDVYLCRRGPNQLWRQHTAGEWQDVTAASGTANGEHACAAAALFDADHDGDLDIFVVNEDGPDELYNNNLDGSFRPLAEAQGLTGAGGGGRGIVVADLDRDRDADILVMRAGRPHDVYLNDRLWRYREAPGFGPLKSQPAQTAVSGDVDADGQVEIYTLDAAGTLREWRKGSDEWAGCVLHRPEVEDGDVERRPATPPRRKPERDTELAASPESRPVLGLQDFDGDGVLELLVARQGNFAVYEIGPNAAREIFAETGDLTALIPVLVEPRRGPALVGLERDGEAARLELWSAGNGRYAFVALQLTGREERGESMRSNASGIGAAVALRVGSRWTLLDSFDKVSAPGQSLQPLSLGLGGAPRADYVAIDWSDGVFQTELGLEPGGVKRIAETQRQLSSCPVLFAFDGSEFAFVSDLLGVGGLGFFVAPGEYAPPRPWEFFRLPAGLVAPRNGRYAFKLTEPMEESAYLDALRLHVYDLPPGWSVTLDERFGSGAPEPTGEPLFYRRAIGPASVVNDRGKDVTRSLLGRDLRAAPVGRLDRRFVGRLAAPHVLTLEFGSALEAGAGRPILIADGWIEYPYSQTMFAAWQADAEYAPPTLEARGSDGIWQTVYEQFGYPAGMPREMALPLDNLPPGTDALRLSTTQEVYWDRIRVAFAEPLRELRAQVLAPALATLRKTGFARRTTGPQRVPRYDYGERAAFWDTKYPAGLYTRFGDVLPLVVDLDDALAIIGPGEETHFEFPAPAEPPAGWRRELVLESRGYAKDMDLYTRHGDTVGPLPVRPEADPGLAAHREALHQRYNVRFQAGH